MPDAHRSLAQRTFIGTVGRTLAAIGTVVIQIDPPRFARQMRPGRILMIEMDMGLDRVAAGGEYQRNP